MLGVVQLTMLVAYLRSLFGSYPLPSSPAALALVAKLEGLYAPITGYSCGIPGLAAITRKDLLGLSVQRMRRTSFGAAFAFAPHTWVLPHQRQSWLASALHDDAAASWITKPPNESCGDGISISRTRAAADLAVEALLRSSLSDDPNVCISEYLRDPLLSFHGHKFDLRLYAVVLRREHGCGGALMRSFMHDDG